MAAKERKLGGYLAKLNERQKDRQGLIKDAFKGEFQAYCGDPALNWALGGYIRGRLNLLWGPTKSGKSTLALKWAAQEQQKRGSEYYVLIFDSEYNYEADDPKTQERLVACGLDPDRVIISHGNDMDTLFAGISDMKADVAAGDLKLAAVIVDSWGGVTVESALKKINANEISDAGNSFGGNAKFINPLIGFFLDLAGEYAVTCFFVQHCIMNMDQYGKRYLLLGGQKLRFLVHSSLFMETVEASDARLASGNIQIAKGETDEMVAVGKRVRAYCDKSRRVVEGRKVEFWFNFEKAEFALKEGSLLELATKIGVIGHPVEMEVDKKGNPVKDKDGNPQFKVKNTHWQFPANPTAIDAVQWYGKPAVLEALSDPILFAKIEAACMDSKILNSTADQTDMKSLIGDAKEENGEETDTVAPAPAKKGKK